MFYLVGFPKYALNNLNIILLIANISKSQAMSLQFAKGAEEALYSDRASIWNDRLFLIFLDNVLNNKHIKKERKLRYQDLRNKISNIFSCT